MQNIERYGGALLFTEDKDVNIINIANITKMRIGGGVLYVDTSDYHYYCESGKNGLKELTNIIKDYYTNNLVVRLFKQLNNLCLIAGAFGSIYLFKLGWDKYKNDCQDNNTKIEITSDKALVYESCKVLFRKTKYYGKKIVYGIGYATPMVISTIFVININKNIIGCS